jgi:hypothetical protein
MAEAEERSAVAPFCPGAGGTPSPRALNNYLVLVDGRFHLCSREWGWSGCVPGWPRIKVPAVERSQPHPVVKGFFTP